ncbi:hypothetical protein H4582DRAFT_2075057 [Lactarius indigo]|nr:hypothetical protein H4582DRAFT_2075057 [Lactarius indigo]
MSGFSVTQADIRNPFGVAFTGLLISIMLFGLTIVQTLIYFWKYWNRDSKWLKFFVAFVTFMDALRTIMCAYVVYWYLILNFGNIESLEDSMWALDSQIIMSIIVGASVELFYARRVYIVSQDIICPILIVVLVAISSFLGIFFTVKEAAIRQFSGFHSHSLTWILCAGMTAGVLADLLVAVVMCWSLYRQRTGFARQTYPFDVVP